MSFPIVPPIHESVTTAVSGISHVFAYLLTSYFVLTHTLTDWNISISEMSDSYNTEMSFKGG